MVKRGLTPHCCGDYGAIGHEQTIVHGLGALRWIVNTASMVYHATLGIGAHAAPAQRMNRDQITPQRSVPTWILEVGSAKSRRVRLHLGIDRLNQGLFGGIPPQKPHPPPVIEHQRAVSTIVPDAQIDHRMVQGALRIVTHQVPPDSPRLLKSVPSVGVLTFREIEQGHG
jgi:hypothetical protein